MSQLKKGKEGNGREAIKERKEEGREDRKEQWRKGRVRGKQMSEWNLK